MQRRGAVSPDISICEPSCHLAFRMKGSAHWPLHFVEDCQHRILFGRQVVGGGDRVGQFLRTKFAQSLAQAFEREDQRHLVRTKLRRDACVPREARAAVRRAYAAGDVPTAALKSLTKCDWSA